MTRPACTRLWGPVTEPRARAIGALAAATSVLIKPDEINEDIEAAVAGLIPLHVLPSRRATQQSRSEYGYQRASSCTRHGFFMTVTAVVAILV